ncbi:hypothetical protein B0H13DRAFT_2319876 [Mycena leptocephala]|nr:hypothetical protein B0H13DRAFT_2319876 [Mycena leptocephala]
MDTKEGGLLWVEIALLFVMAVILPLIAPRAYIPVDPLVDLFPLPLCHTRDFQNPIQPNAEQTASILSSYLFLFLDRTDIFGKQKEQVNLKKSFPYLNEFRGAPKRHIFFALLKTFRFRLVVAFVYMVLCVPADYISALGINRLLTYLEAPADAVVRPWVWIATLFLGAALGAVLNEAYTSTMYIVMIEAEAIIISLVFEHALRIRVKAESPNAPATPDSTPSSHTASESTALKAAAVPPDSSNLIGKINNLIATDAITAANKGKDLLISFKSTPGVTRDPFNRFDISTLAKILRDSSKNFDFRRKNFAFFGGSTNRRVTRDPYQISILTG